MYDLEDVLIAVLINDLLTDDNDPNPYSDDEK